MWMTYITGACDQDILNVKQFLNAKFTIKDLGYLHCFLGIEVAKSVTKTISSQYRNMSKTSYKMQDWQKTNLFQPLSLKV